MSARVVAVTTTACSSEKPAGSDGVVAGRDHRDGALRPGVLDGVAERAAEHALERAAAEAEVDDVGAVVGGPPDPGGHVVGGPGGRAGAAAVAAVLEHADRQEAGVGRHAGDAPAVVGGGQRDAGHVGAVAVVVLARARARRRRRRSAPMQLTCAVELAAPGPRGPGRRPESTTAMVMPSPVPRAHAPGRADALEAPLEPLLEHRVVRRRRRRRRPARARRSAASPAPQRAASDRTDRRIHPSSVRTDAAGARSATSGQRRRRTVTTLPKTDTSSASNSIGESRAFDGSSVTVLPLRR